MRKTTAALSALALSAIALTGCSAAVPSFEGASCERTVDPALEMAVKVTGDIGKANVKVESPVRSAEFSYTDLTVGDGAAITDAEQFGIYYRTLVNGKTGELIHQGVSFWSPDTASAEFPGVGDALACATEGSRILVSIPAKTLPESLPQQLGLGAKDNLIAVYDLRSTMLAKAEGAPVFNDASGLPTVVRAADGRPGIIIPGNEAPTKTVVQTLIAGNGEKVGDSTAVVQVTSVGWQSREVVDSTWGNGVADVSGLPEEVQKFVADAPIGSQLMAVVPDENGDATAYVIDIVGVIPTELTQE